MRIFSFLFLLTALLVSSVLSTVLRAQTNWTAASSGTTQNLWGICYGGGQFVAVGENGTILTSSDGSVWTARNAGTTNWLLAVAYAADLQRFVIVGDQGLVLASSDAITWTARTSGTTQRLNGVAYGGRFLAVGEAGTACTSTDGVIWTTRTVPNAGWLRGVAAGSGNFVICGQVTGSTAADWSVWFTTDAAQFDRSIAGLPSDNADLEAAAFDGSRFLIAGRAVALAPASLPLNWRTKFVEIPSITAPPFRYFRGAAFFNNTWIAVGALTSPLAGSSPVIFNQPNATSWQNATGVSITASLNAVAANSTVAITVGQGGTVWRSAASQSVPQPFLISQPATIIATVGGTVQLAADASGTAPLTYQWNFNGRPIADATLSALTLTDLQLAQSGSYTLTATNGLGSATSTPYSLTMVSPVAVTAPVDPNFFAPLTGAATVLAVQPDGSVLVGAPTTNVTVGGQLRTDLVRLNPDGSLDSTFHTTTGFGFTGVDMLANGQLLVGGTPSYLPVGVVNVARDDATYTRLNSDGTPDASFPASSMPNVHTVLADGRILGAIIAQNSLTLARFTADGVPDASFAAAPIVLATTPPWAVDISYSSALFAKLPDGRIMLVATAFTQIGTGQFGRDESSLVRLNADGTRDPTFAIATTTAPIVQLVATGEKLCYRYATRAGPMGFTAVAGIGRLNADGTADAGYRTGNFSAGLYAPALQLASDGSFYFLPANSRVLARYDADGVRDPEFSARFVTDVSFAQIVPIDGRRQLVTGKFTALNGTRASYLARLTPDTQASATRLTNLSIRQLAGTGSQTLIVGFVIAGQGYNTLLLRGIGPTLSAFNVTNPVADLTLSLFDETGALRLTNDNWSDGADVSAIAATSASVGAFALPAGSKDAAAIATLPVGSFTMQLGIGGAPGVALAEGYDTGGTPSDYTAARVVNFSGRATAGFGDGTLIAGFTISGPNVKRLLIRAVGPGLNQFGVTGTLADPQLTLYSGSIAVAANDNWGGGADLSDAFTVTGAFPISPDGKDAALLITLPPGGYTAQVSGVNNTTGVALVEVYEVR